MMRSTIVALVLAATLAASCTPEEGRRPDVILVSVDTLRADRLSCYGYPRPTSPVIDGLAAEGALFLDATAQAPWTLPSMVSLLTGRYVAVRSSLDAVEDTADQDFFEQAGFRSSIHADEHSLAEVFQRAGYRTIAAVGNPSLREQSGFGDGFDVYHKPKVERGGSLRPPFGMTLLEHALERIDEAYPEESARRPPLFLLFHPFDPHAPYEEHAASELALDGAVPVFPEGWQDAALRERGPDPPSGDPGWTRALGSIAKERGRYDREVEYTDRVVGELLAALRERGFLDDAIVALVSDHGEGLWDRVAARPVKKLSESRPDEFFYQAHGAHMYQEAIHTPFVLWGSGVPSGLVVSEAVENVDLFPTLLELTDIAAPEGLHGVSLGPLLGGGERSPRHVFSYAFQTATIREPETGLKLNLLLVDELSARFSTELFDLESDPLERHDLSSERPEDVARLRGLLSEWFERYRSELPEDEIHPEQAEELRGLGYTEEDIGG